jgi:hypothetical protein
MNWRKPKTCSLNDVFLEVASCNTGHCLEVATDDGNIAIRESVRPGTVVVTSRANFAAFIAAAKAGEYDDLCEDRDAG